MNRIRFFALLLSTAILPSLLQAAPKIRWPKDAIKQEMVEQIKEAVEKDDYSVAFIFFPAEYDEDDQAVINSMDATNDAIRSLKSFCVIVKGDFQAVSRKMQGVDNEVPDALVEGLQKAGNSYPLVVVLDGDMETVFAATSGKELIEEGSKIFRDAKKKHREALKERKEEE